MYLKTPKGSLLGNTPKGRFGKIKGYVKGVKSFIRGKAADKPKSINTPKTTRKATQETKPVRY